MLGRYKLSMAAAAVLAALAAPMAHADEVAPAISVLDDALLAQGLPADTQVGPRSRADVIAEFEQARAEGLLDDTSSGPSPQVTARREARNAEQFEQIVAANEKAEQERLAAAEQAAQSEQTAQADSSTSEMMLYEDYRAAYSDYVGDTSYMGPAGNPAVTQPQS